MHCSADENYLIFCFLHLLFSHKHFRNCSGFSAESGKKYIKCRYPADWGTIIWFLKREGGFFKIHPPDGPEIMLNLTPKCPMSFSSWQVFMTTAILEIRSAACCRTLADLLFNLQRIVPQICGRYGLTRLLKLLTIVPNPFNITTSSVVCSCKYKTWKINFKTKFKSQFWNAVF